MLIKPHLVKSFKESPAVCGGSGDRLPGFHLGTNPGRPDPGMPGLPYFKVAPELALGGSQTAGTLTGATLWGGTRDTGAGKGSALSVSPYLTGDARPVCVRKALWSLDLRLLVSYRGAQLWLRLLATAAAILSAIRQSRRSSSGSQAIKTDEESALTRPHAPERHPPPNGSARPCPELSAKQ